MTDLSLSVDIAIPLSSQFSKVTISNADGNVIASIGDQFIFAADTNTFTATAEALNTLLEQLLGGELIFSANMVSEDFEFAEAYDFIFLKSTVTITGQLVDVAGSPLAGIEIDDLNVAVIGRDSNIRQVVSVNIDGQFLVENLIRETYRLTVTDLQQPNVYTTALGVFSATINAQLNVLYAPPCSQ